MYLGDYIIIEKQIGPFSFSCSCVSTGTDFSATIDPDKRDLFQDHSFPNQYPSACRFLRPLGEGRIGCTIHQDSPPQCKYYRCVVMQIFTKDEEEVGTVTGTLALHSQDPVLCTVWNGISQEISGNEPDAEEKIRQSLMQAGYQVR